MTVPKNKVLIISGTALVVIAMGVFVFFTFRRAEKEYGFICPSDFTDRKEYMESVARWISEYQKDYPSATAEDMMAVRDRFSSKYHCGSAPIEAADLPSEKELDTAKLMAGIKYAESQREDPAADAVIKTTNEKELYSNPYIKHIRTALNGYLDGTMNGVEEGTSEKSELDSGYRCGLDSFDKAYYKSEFTVLKVEKNDYGGVVAYIAFLNKPDTIFWSWVYQYAGGEYILRGFCENAALVEQ